MNRKSVFNKGCDIQDLPSISTKFTDWHFKYLERMRSNVLCSKWAPQNAHDTGQSNDKNIPSLYIFMTRPL